MAQKYNLSSRRVQAPLAAFCMATILFVYARKSIQAAKQNAQRHREADGGQISWRNESLRRHGALETPEEPGILSLLSLKKSGRGGAGAGVGGGERSGEGEGQEVVQGEAETREERIIRSRALGGR